MPKTLFLWLLTVLSLGLLKTPQAQTAEQSVSSARAVGRIGQKLQDYVKEQEGTRLAKHAAALDRML
ncbi:hypothetical protein STRDD11_02512 [Streptococcus sp. DD11]|uniref:hypothetical protein n=1 Tax=Streptococcus sp. DD11 TaxID=1777879 RepID=UPI000796D917|nr:hypothetical protein [Streptococcus sp. DD11]KXT77845.1 hypothetical protein STRDD11_02512 [Streptococcus sp. DD11]